MGRSDEWKMLFQDFRSTCHRHRDHRTAGFLRDLQASLFKRKKLCDIVVRISRSFREDPDGNAVFHFFDSLKDRL